eukprot:IDg5663t1
MRFRRGHRRTRQSRSARRRKIIRRRRRQLSRRRRRISQRRRRTNQRRRALNRRHRRLQRMKRSSYHGYGRHSTIRRSVQYLCLAAAQKQCLVFALQFSLQEQGIKCANPRARRLLLKKSTRQLLCRQAASNVCIQLECHGKSNILRYKCLMNVPIRVRIQLKAICNLQKSHTSAITGGNALVTDPTLPQTKTVTEKKLVSAAAPFLILPSATPSSSSSATPSSSPSITPSTSPTPSSSTSATPSPSVSASASESPTPSVSASSSPSASTSATPSSSASASVSVSSTPSVSSSPSASVSASASVSVTPTPSTSSPPVCSSISQQICAASCSIGATQMFSFQCPGSGVCCRPKDCQIVSGHRCEATCSQGFSEQQGFFCQGGHNCCRPPPCTNESSQVCSSSCGQNVKSLSGFFCEGELKCCPLCSNMPQQSCKSKCSDSMSKGYGFCENQLHCCRYTETETSKPSVTVLVSEQTSAPTPAAMKASEPPSSEVAPTDEPTETSLPEENYEDEDGESEADSDDCDYNGGKCSSTCVTEGTEPDSSLKCPNNLSCCIAPEITKCDGEGFKCLKNGDSCTGSIADDLPGCSDGMKCCDPALQKRDSCCLCISSSLAGNASSSEFVLVYL